MSTVYRIFYRQCSDIDTCPYMSTVSRTLISRQKSVFQTSPVDVLVTAALTSITIIALTVVILSLYSLSMHLHCNHCPHCLPFSAVIISGTASHCILSFITQFSLSSVPPLSSLLSLSFTPFILITAYSHFYLHCKHWNVITAFNVIKFTVVTILNLQIQ